MKIIEIPKYENIEYMLYKNITYGVYLEIYLLEEKILEQQF